MTVTINGATGIAGVNGTATLPAVQGSDTNTGVFYPVVDTVAISTGGVEAMRIDSSGIVTGTVGNLMLISGTAQAQPASPAVASVDFTDIPSWVKRVTVMLNNVSTNGVSPPLIQIGSGSVTSSGYLGVAVSMATAAGITGSNATTGFQISSILAANVIHGIMTINLVDSATFNYTASFSGGCTSPVNALVSSGSVTLTGLLDRVRITTVGGANTFDAGTINILYE